MMQTDYEQMYQDGNPPWDHGFPDINLEQTIERFSIKPGNVLDLGCGMGNNSIWLAQQGFRVHGFDLSETAVSIAKGRFAEQKIPGSFQVGNFLADPVEQAPFELIFDRGCFHCIHDDDERAIFAENVAVVLEKHGLWISLIGNADEPKREVGPPQLSVQEIAMAVEPFFECLMIESGWFGDKQENPPRAWICLFRKRSA